MLSLGITPVCRLSSVLQHDIEGITAPTATEPPGDGEDATKRVNEQIPDEHNEAATYRTSRQAHDVPDVEDAEARSVEAKELIVAQVGESRPSHAAGTIVLSFPSLPRLC